MVGPQLAHRQPVDVFFLGVRPLDDVPQDARRDARFEIGAVAGAPVAGKEDAAVRGAQLLGAERAQFVAQQFFQPARADGEIGVHQKGFRTTRKTTAKSTSTGISL